VDDREPEIERLDRRLGCVLVEALSSADDLREAAHSSRYDLMTPAMVSLSESSKTSYACSVS